jgi:hypothetical protein
MNTVAAQVPRKCKFLFATLVCELIILLGI